MLAREHSAVRTIERSSIECWRNVALLCHGVRSRVTGILPSEPSHTVSGHCPRQSGQNAMLFIRTRVGGTVHPWGKGSPSWLPAIRTLGQWPQPRQGPPSLDSINRSSTASACNSLGYPGEPHRSGTRWVPWPVPQGRARKRESAQRHGWSGHPLPLPSSGKGPPSLFAILGRLSGSALGGPRPLPASPEDTALVKNVCGLTTTDCSWSGDSADQRSRPCLA